MKKIKDTILTTPSNLDLYQFAHSSIKQNYNCISEASSHGIHQDRFKNIKIYVAAITNISHDHLDYHKSFNEYVNTKISLLTKSLNSNGVAVINSQLKKYKIIEKKLKNKKIKMITYGSKDVFFIKKDNLYLKIFGKKYKLDKLKLENKIQKENFECAIACAWPWRLTQKNY